MWSDFDFNCTAVIHHYTTAADGQCQQMAVYTNYAFYLPLIYLFVPLSSVRLILLPVWPVVVAIRHFTRFHRSLRLIWPKLGLSIAPWPVDHLWR